MDDEIRARMSELTAGNVYCDLILSAVEAAALQQLVTVLRAGGQHQVLDQVFLDIIEEIERSREIEASDDPWRITSGPSGV